MKLRALTNVRPTKELGNQVILAPTEGQFKVTPDACKHLGVSTGEYCGVVVDDESGTGYVFKGSEEGLGAKLASSNKGGGGVLTFSAAAGWSELKGSSAHNTHYNVGETPIAAEDLAGTPFEDYTLYPLEFDKQVEKQARKAKEEGDVVPVAEAPPVVDEVTQDDFSDM